MESLSFSLRLMNTLQLILLLVHWKNLLFLQTKSQNLNKISSTQSNLSLFNSEKSLVLIFGISIKNQWKEPNIKTITLDSLLTQWKLSFSRKINNHLGTPEMKSLKKYQIFFQNIKLLIQESCILKNTVKWTLIFHLLNTSHLLVMIKNSLQWLWMGWKENNVELQEKIQNKVLNTQKASLH